MPHQRVELAAPQPPRKLQRYGHVLLELRDALGIAQETSVSPRHVPRVEVEESDLQPCLLDRRLHLPEVLARRPPELHCPKARLPSPAEPLQQWNLLKQDRNVGAELHLRPPLPSPDALSTLCGSASGSLSPCYHPCAALTAIMPVVILEERVSYR